MYTGIIPESQIKLPKTSYKLQILEVEAKASAKGNPMIVIKCEIKDSQEFVQDGVNVNPNGIVITHYVTLTDKSIGYDSGFNGLMRGLGLPTAKNEQEAQAFDKNQLLDKCVGAICETKEGIMKIAGSEETMLNPMTGKPVVRMDKRIAGFLAL